MSKPKIGVIGTGMVGIALATGYVQHGYDVVLGSREGATNDKVAGWLAKANSPHARGGTFAEAAAFGDIVVLAVGEEHFESAIKQAGSLDGKIVIDATNPIEYHKTNGPVLKMNPTSLGEKVQELVGPKAHVVKTYNYINNKFMLNPDAQGLPLTGFVAGENADAKKVVIDLLKATGWSDIVDLGGISSARALEGLALVWIKMAAQNGFKDIDFGFKVTHKQ